MYIVEKKKCSTLSEFYFLRNVCVFSVNGSVFVEAAEIPGE